MNTQQKEKIKHRLRGRRRIIPVLAVCALCLTGCGQVVDLTDEENHLIAEYAAELLLKYDGNYDMKYDPDAVEEATLTDADTESDTTEETTEETTATTESADNGETSGTEDAGQTQNTEESSTGDGQTTQAQPSESEAVTETIAATVESDFDIAAFVGEDRISVRYLYYTICDSYPSYDKDGMSIEVEAPDGYRLLVLKFSLENKTDSDQAIDLYSKDIDYNIIINQSRTTKQMLTILTDDLYTYEKTIRASEREELVLLYTVSDSVAESITDLKLKVQYGDTSAVLQLEQ